MLGKIEAEAEAPVFWSPYAKSQGLQERFTGMSISHVQLFAAPWTVAYQAPLSMDFPGNSTGMDCHFLLQRIFLTQGSNPGLPHGRQTLYHLSHQGSPKVKSLSRV